MERERKRIFYGNSKPSGGGGGYKTLHILVRMSACNKRETTSGLFLHLM